MGGNRPRQKPAVAAASSDTPAASETSLASVEARTSAVAEAPTDVSSGQGDAGAEPAGDAAPDSPPEPPPADDSSLFPTLDLAALLPKLPREPVRLRGRMWLMLLALVVAVGLDLRVALRPERPRISADTMARARAEILAQRKPGNLVVHSPLLTLAELAPLGDLAARPDVPSPELRRARRVWVIDLAERPMFLGLRRPSMTQDLGEGLVLRVFEPAGGQPTTLFDLVSDVDRTDLRIERPRGKVSSRCTEPRPEGGRSCPGEADWLYLAARTLTIEGKNAACVWAHPTTGGDLVFTIPAMPEPSAGQRLVLEVASAMTDEAVSLTPDGASVRTDIEQGGRIKGGVTLVNRVGWARTELTLDPGVPTDLRVSTPRDGRRHHCLTARVYEGGLK